MFSIRTASTSLFLTLNPSVWSRPHLRRLVHNNVIDKFKYSKEISYHNNNFLSSIFCIIKSFIISINYLPNKILTVSIINFLTIINLALRIDLLPASRFWEPACHWNPFVGSFWYQLEQNWLIHSVVYLTFMILYRI